MEEILARLTAIEERLENLEYREDRSHEGWEAANEHRQDDISRLDRRIEDGLSDVRYELDRVRDDARRSGRGW